MRVTEGSGHELRHDGVGDIDACAGEAKAVGGNLEVPAVEIPGCLVQEVVEARLSETRQERREVDALLGAEGEKHHFVVEAVVIKSLDLPDISTALNGCAVTDSVR